MRIQDFDDFENKSNKSNKKNKNGFINKPLESNRTINKMV